ncbi:MAG: UDP-N-acetylenolpyruvoylglucosamine reductase, UDP-N-acetylmuramate dehydrogenase [Candidatus Peregrinibacteria bacterium GW2011_GWF2_33_10]|nr:MAG: UDP-N-acetylenolpyruvoylglucosamine reductase, UDP-N-acetylmuramate dehydrogenase [Candidatus Peregrinibacteria bacterium GW2011_GWF2_33_10]OGJ45787.1 MAG: UDP-N-acetylenolpyruvoylglucosamine reductase [Candidatus Peregrinibacteria bacterium RIFOXYA2_FULL_33_21]OGJ46847.1 MAG: UDP-N-acetylenolpyruvoylglucosamine reductase [Candidatus Peregrinibacteria bacterium RIFOXYA12_FULL_33_12]OGJ51316.1 MAG: UDP-N-acetylenolpyruvoylglucosamine reductase [Candidatus Peregrinibacteria bacterium RIFOX
MEATYQALIQRFLEIKKDELLSKHTTLMIGGQADLFWECRDVRKLPEFLDHLKKLSLKFFILGGGSNVLFDSRGFRGCVIKIVDNSFEFDDDNLIAASGTRMTILAKMTMQQGLSGLEWANGIPGTIGGAVFGNAGCHGQDISRNLSKAVLYSPNKGIFEAEKGYFQFSYRHSILKTSQDIVLKAYLKLQKKAVNFEQSQQAVSFRNDKQPFGLSSGSFFKNSLNDSAGRLIEAVGLKGCQIGQAQISPKHANFFMNLGGATSDDILALRDLAKQKVAEKFHINLEEEVVIVDC